MTVASPDRGFSCQSQVALLEGSSRLDKGPHNAQSYRGDGFTARNEGISSLKTLHGLVQLSTALRSRGGTDALSCLRPRQSSRS